MGREGNATEDEMKNYNESFIKHFLTLVTFIICTVIISNSIPTIPEKIEFRIGGKHDSNIYIQHKHKGGIGQHDGF